MKTKLFLILNAAFLIKACLLSQNTFPDIYNVSWTNQSINSSESMPCGGGDVGLNVWVEDNDILFYFSRSGTFDENNTFLKLGRVRLKMSPNPFKNGDFSQELRLNEGYVLIKGSNDDLKAEIEIWADVFLPVIHVEFSGNQLFNLEAIYENWRFQNRLLEPSESFQNSYKWAPPEGLKMYHDEFDIHEDQILFYHRNSGNSTIFDVTVHQQGFDSVKNTLFNPLKNLTFGGVMSGNNLYAGQSYIGKYQDTPYKAFTLKSGEPSKKYHLKVYLHTSQSENIEIWQKGLKDLVSKTESDDKDSKLASRNWWKKYWQRSFIIIEPDTPNPESSEWQMGRNYQLFRYMLGCNAYGSYPTKFNGGLFTYDPCFVDSTRCFTPDHRNWGGGTFTAQNQRLVYFPMLKSGDFDLMKPQLDFYLRILKTAELRSQIYWGHSGACFTEQIENFGLPNCSEYGWDRPACYEKGLQYNAWLEYQWDTALEFCLMMLEQYYYAGKDISEYLDFIKSCLVFFDEHYQYLAKRRGRRVLDENGDLIMYPGSGCETYKMAYNATSTIVGLKVVLKKLLALPEEYLNAEEKEKFREFQERIPSISYRNFDNYITIAPARLWQRINNTEAPQLYPVFPYGIYGIGKPGLDTAINTYKYDTDLLKFRSHVGWKQDNIFAARLGLTDEAFKLTRLKLQDSGRRFPAFWGPGFDYVPDHNWGGSGMIGLQEMLMQCVDEKIYLFPTWPKNIDVHFKLHALNNTVVEAELKNGKVSVISVEPGRRRKDIVLN